MKVKKKYFINFLFILILLGVIVYAADYYQILDNATKTINETYVCTRVKNNNCPGAGIFIPTKTQTEWNNFNSNNPSCSSISQDFDGDGYLINASIYCPAYSGTVGSDCYDDNANAYPGQLTYQITDRGDGSFDYNCNGVIDKQYAEISCSSSSVGWNYYIPSCGGSGTWCNEYYCTSCSSRTQGCL